MDNKEVQGFWMRFSKWFNYLNWGVFVVQKFQFIVTLVILLKVFEVGFWYYIIAPIAILFVIFFVGILWDRKVKENFNSIYFGKGFKYDTDKTK